MTGNHLLLRALALSIALLFLAPAGRADDNGQSLLDAVRHARQAQGLPAGPLGAPPTLPAQPVPAPVAPTTAGTTSAPANGTASTAAIKLVPMPAVDSVPGVASGTMTDASPAKITDVPIGLHSDVVTTHLSVDSANGSILRFDNADIYEVVQTVMGDYLHLNFVVDPGVTGKVNINAQTPISGNELLGVLQTVLAFNNVSIIREGNLYKVVRDSAAPHDSVSGSAVGDNGMLVQIFAPRFVQPSALINTLKGFIGAQASVTNDPTDHYLILVDRARNAKKLQELVQSLDIDYLNQVQTEIVQIQYGDASDVAKEMETLFKTSQMFNWRGTEANKVFFMPIKRMNSILVAAANKEILTAAKNRIRDVDVELKNGINSRINIYNVKNSSAAYLASMISQIYGGPATSSTSSSGSSLSDVSRPTNSSTGSSTGLGSSSSGSSGLSSSASKVVEKGATATISGSGLAGEMEIIPNIKANSLIINASRQDYLQILHLLEQLDTVPRQVLIQANIIEVTLNKENRLGFEWSLLKEHIVTNGTTSPTTLTIGAAPISQAGSAAAVASSTGSVPAGSGLLYTIFPTAAGAIGQLQAFASDDNINILSSPRILASDGKEAKIEVGEDVPVQSSAITQPGTTVGLTTLATSYDYRTVGLLMQIKPTINDSGMVDLEINQEVSSVVNNSNATGTTPSFTKRSIKTEVTLQEGKTLLIGGLIQDQTEIDDSGVPVLKDLPLIGALFRTRDKTTERTELLMTLTPYILRNPNDSERISSELDDGMNDARKLLDKFSHVSKVPVKVTNAN